MTASGLRLLGWLASLMVVPVVSFYLLLDWEALPGRVLALLPPRLRAPAARLLRESDEVLASFLRGQLAVMLILAVVYATGLWWIGLELALPIGLAAGLASFVPYLGFLVGIAAAGLAAYLQFQEASVLLWVLAVFAGGQLLEGLVLTPRLVGERVGLHPVAVIFAVMAGGQLFGFLGVLLALPAAAVLKVWLRHLHAQALAAAASPPPRRQRARPPSSS
jgi:predicted PurR-regulated permease PerM